MTGPDRNERIDRFARDALSEAEARDLARESLEDPALFEELTSLAMAKAALESPTAQERLRIKPPARRPALWIGIAAAAAVATAFFAYTLQTRRPDPSVTAMTSSQAAPAVLPTLSAERAGSQPVLIAEDLQPAASTSVSTFRGQTETSRAPRQSGTVVSTEDGVVNIDLGSLDGLSRGGSLPVYSSGRNVGAIKLSAVFRERSRGSAALPGVLTGAAVRVPDTLYWDALLDHLDGLGASDSIAARKAAEEAIAWAQSARLALGLVRSGLHKLAALEYRTGDVRKAEEHYQAAVDALSSEPFASAEEQDSLLNSLAALRLLRGDQTSVEALLGRSASAFGSNNLGVLAEILGDKQKAESLYAAALSRMPVSQSAGRQRVEANLARVRGTR